jgi:hypothetical protein
MDPTATRNTAPESHRPRATGEIYLLTDGGLISVSWPLGTVQAHRLQNSLGTWFTDRASSRAWKEAFDALGRVIDHGPETPVHC